MAPADRSRDLVTRTGYEFAVWSAEPADESREHHVAIDVQRQQGFVAPPDPNDALFNLIQRQVQVR